MPLAKRAKPKKAQVREEAEFYLKVLLDLHDKTDPAKGRSSEKGKLARARHAIETWWRLHDHLMHWAQSHMVGYCIVRADPSMLDILPRIDRNEITENSHELEYIGQGFGWNPRRIDDAYGAKLEKLGDKAPGIDDATMRTIIVELLVSRSANSSFWRFDLQEALRALNAGEQLDLVKPLRRRRQGAAFRLLAWKHAAMLQVQFRVGQGMKKHRVLEEVGKAIGQSPETLRSWEKELRDDEDFAFELYCAELAGRLGDELTSRSENELADDYGMDVHRGVTEFEMARLLVKRVKGTPLEMIRDRIRHFRAKR